MRSLIPACVRVCTTCLFVGVASLNISAQELPTVVRVEEHWELQVDSTDANSTAPQLTCTISPTQSTDSLYATFDLNHHSQPSFTPGGLQLQLWNQEIRLCSHPSPSQSVLSTQNETIRWTQSMEITGGQLTFEIIDGTSTTWGNFGGQGYLKASAATTLTNLNGYQPTTSVENSGVGYAANRVGRLALKRVRLVLHDGLVLEDTTERVVWSKN